MNLLKVKTIDDLKLMGSVNEIISEIEKNIAPLKVAANSFEELHNVVVTLRKHWLPFFKGPFVSKQAEYIYYLTILEGKQRNRALGIRDEYYENPEVAKKWYKKIARYVHPDIGGDKRAFTVLNKLYNVMKDAE